MSSNRLYTPPFPEPGPAEPAGLLVFNARIHTLRPDTPTASVMAARGAELVYVGDDRRKAAALLPPRAVKLDLEGRPVIPGLIDGHAHVVSEGLRLAELILLDKSRAEILALIGREAATRPPGDWIVGQGWNQEHWPGQDWPTKEELDAVAPHHPVAMDRVDKHSTWVNSEALRRAGLTDQSPDPPGGEFVRDPAGRLKGVLVGQAMWAVKDLIPPPDERRLHQALLRAQAEMLGFGLTSVMEAGATLKKLEVMEKAYQDGELKLRIRAMLLAREKQDEAYLAAGGRRVDGLFGERLSINGVKIHSDGSLGSRSAWLYRDYADRPGHRGGHNYSDQELLAILERARAHDLGVSIHVIGDAAVGQAVAAMERVLRKRPGDHRWRLEHFQVVTERDLELTLALKLIPSIQSVGLMSDLEMAEDRLGPKRLKLSYAWREILNRGGILVNGSDAPVESANPFWGMYAAVTRRNLAGRPPGGWRPEERLTREEALKTYTTWAAWSEFNEHRKGSLAAGMLADFIVLDRDPLVCPEEEIKDTQVLLTILGGEIVHPRA